MLSAALLLLCNSLFLSLHLSGNTGSFPKPLSPAKEQEYLARCAAGDLDARNTLVEHNLRLVSHILKKYYTRSADQEDLVSIGTIGLIKAIDNFDINQPVRFSTYGVPMIVGEIRRYLRDNSAIRVSRSLRDTAYKVLQARERLLRQSQREPTVEDRKSVV